MRKSHDLLWYKISTSIFTEPNEEARRTTEPTPEAAPGGSQADQGGISPLVEAPKAEEARRPVADLSPAERTQIVDRVRRGLAIAIDKFRPVYEALGVPIEENSTEHASIIPTNNGSIYEKALALTQQEPERRFLENRLKELKK